MSSYLLNVQMRADAAQLLSGLRTASGALRSLGQDVDRMHRTLGRVGSSGAGLRGLAGDTDAARRGLRGLGADGENGTRRLHRGLLSARQEAHHLRSLLVGGGIVAGIAEIAKQGNEYQRSIQKWGAVTNASGVEMVRAAAKARELGSDLTIPGTSAAKAADAMVELAKAGQTSFSSISNARAAMQLAAADNLSAADAAKYLGDVMDQFGLSSNNAGRAADVLASGANAASGGLIDIYYAMSYTGPVAAQLGVSLEDTATATAMLARSGILGSKAGTSLRGMLTNLAAPSKRAKQGLAELGIEAWDAEGRFKGLRNMIEGFEQASKRMNPQEFNAAMSKLVGKPALAGALAFAHQGVASFDQLRTAIGRTGAAGEIAASQTKGLAGAVTQLKSQWQTTTQTLYTAAAPGLEAFTRLATAGLGAATPVMEGALDYLHDLYTLAGPGLGVDLAEIFDKIGDAFDGVGGALGDLSFDLLVSGLNLLANAGQGGLEVIENLGEGLAPVGDALAELVGEAGPGASAVDMITMALNLVIDAGVGASAALGPIGSVVGWLVSAFTALPGPVQLAMISMLMASRVTPVMSRLAGQVSGPLVSAYRGWGEQMRVHAAAAAASGESVSRMGQHLAVLQARVPVIGQMGAAFRSAETRAQGLTRAMGAGLGSAARGLMGALGGPWGVALAAAGVGLGLLASHQQKAAAATAAHQARVSSLTQALRESNGAITDSVRATAAQNVMDTKVFGEKEKLVDVMKEAGVTARQVTDAYLGQGTGLAGLQAQLEATAQAERRAIVTAAGGAVDYTERGLAAARAAKALGAVKGELESGMSAARDLADAQALGAKSAADSVGPFGRFSDAMRRLSDSTSDADSRARALHEALTVLAGGSVSLSAAENRLNSAVSSANESISQGVDQTQGYGKTLLNMDGTLSTVTRNGQRLYDTFQGLGTSAADASLAAYQYAQTNGKDVGASLEAAQEQMEKARQAAISTARGYGLGAEEAARLADAAGLIPEQVSMLLQTAGMDEATAELIAVQQSLKATPDEKTVTVSTLSDEARSKLTELGFSLKDLPDRRVEVTASTEAARIGLDGVISRIAATPSAKTVNVTSVTGAAMTSLQLVQAEIARVPWLRTVTVAAPTDYARSQLEALGFTIAAVPNSKNVTVTAPTGDASANVSALAGAIASLQDRTVHITTVYDFIGGQPAGPWAGGYKFEAQGGILTYYAAGGMRQEQHVAQIARGGEWRVWAEDETGGEAYIPLASAKRTRSKAILGEVARRFGGEVSYHASGSVSGGDWSYEPRGSSTFGISSVVTMARDKEGEFSLSLFEKRLKSSVTAAQEWRANLVKVAQRAGTGVAQALAEMGEDGVELTKKMAGGSAKYVADMAAQLEKLADAAKGSLSDFTVQAQARVKDGKAFQENLAKLAGAGYGSLAARLAEQGDETAAKLAREAVASPSKAAEADKAAKETGRLLAGDQLADLVKIIAALGSGRGLHTVAETAQLDEDRVIEVAGLAVDQIKKAAGAKAAKFLADLGKAQKGLAYASGGIWEPGIYPGRGQGLVKFAEAETGGEAFIPLATSKRRRALGVLGEVAGRFGVGQSALPVRTVPASAPAVKVVVVREPDSRPLVGSMPVTVTSPGASAGDISAAVMRRLRAAQRGGRA
ncbi:phage tail tape measure protein (plasmid) [Streptomyces sp. BI20]|uniref:phage tail tape measure protein n=1 Tax=Streptomyces sp. BI20 TaxID=3403460 RepID=UPI003C7096D2